MATKEKEIDATVETPEQAVEVPNAPVPPEKVNPLIPKVEEETFERYVISSDAFPMKRIELHYPTKIEEIKIRNQVRKLAYDLNVSPDDLDTWSQNQFYVSALLSYASDNDEPIKWLEIQPRNRKANEALEVAVNMIINWRFLSDPEEDQD